MGKTYSNQVKRGNEKARRQAERDKARRDKTQRNDKFTRDVID